MKPFATFALATALGASCASDQPRDEAPTPVPTPSTPVARPGQLAPPPSAHAGAVAVWEKIRETCGGDVRLRSLKSTTVMGRDDRPDRVHVRLDFVVVGVDAIDATAKYVASMDALSGAPWCENVQRAPSGIFDSGQALGIHGLKVLYRPAVTGWTAGTAEPDPELIARRLADEAGFGPMDSRILRRTPAPGIVDTNFGFRPTAGEEDFSLDQVLDFVASVEEATHNLNVTNFDLRARRRTRDAAPSTSWSFEFQLTSRTQVAE